VCVCVCLRVFVCVRVCLCTCVYSHSIATHTSISSDRLQRAPTPCNKLQHTLQRVPVCGRYTLTLQQTATNYHANRNVLQCVASTHSRCNKLSHILRCVAVCRTHMHTATLDSNCNSHGSLLQCGRHASTLQHPATNCNTHCSLLQCVAEIHLNCRSCIKLQHTPLCVAVWQIHNHTATLYNKLQQTLQCVAASGRCTFTLQRPATNYITLCCVL